MIRSVQDHQRIVITGVGLTAPNGDTLADYRAALLAGKSGVEPYNIRYVGDTLAGVCHFNYDTKVWTHHHNPRTVANNPAGEITLNMGITGPHYTIGAACAAGNAGLIQGAQMLLLHECDFAIAGGVSESIRTFGIFAGFASQGALAAHEDPAKASRPFDRARNGIVVSEGGCIYTLERYSDAARRGAKIY